MSTVRIRQPWGRRWAAMKSACSLAWASVMVVPNASQLFQPIGGVAAQPRKSGFAGERSAAATATASDRNSTEVRVRSPIAAIRPPCGVSRSWYSQELALHAGPATAASSCQRAPRGGRRRPAGTGGCIGTRIQARAERHPQVKVCSPHPPQSRRGRPSSRRESQGHGKDAARQDLHAGRSANAGITCIPSDPTSMLPSMQLDDSALRTNCGRMRLGHGNCCQLACMRSRRAASDPSR